MALQNPKAIGVQGFFETLAAKLPSFEHRQEQYDLTVKMATALQTKTNLVAQAPTGTGKSFAVTGAVISEYHGTQRRAIIATANNSLLEQYASKDLPFLTSIFPSLKWARAKGKNNYACNLKGDNIFSQMALFKASDSMNKLQQWFDSTHTGDKEEIDFNLSAEDWGKVNADDSCTGKKCPLYSECHYYKAKAQVQKAEIIITNTHLLLLDLLNPELELFPPADAIIFDEAHQIEDIAISQMETSLTAQQVSNYILKAQKEYGVAETQTANISQATGAFFSAFRSILAQGEEKKSIIPNDALRDLTSHFQRSMNELAAEVKRFKTEPDTRPRRLQEALISNITSAGRAAMAAVTNDTRHVSWVEQTKTDFKIVTAPFRIAKKMDQMVFSNPYISFICLSATLGGEKKTSGYTKDAAGNIVEVQGPMFEQFRQRIGLVNAAEFDCPSPFNYQKNCMLYLPTPPVGMKTPNDEGFTFWMLDQIVQLVELSRGRAFVLTTSNKALKQIHGHLSAVTNFPIKAQGTGMANGQLIKWFKETENSILVGTNSFWEGISVEGDDLKLVIIDKIPFVSHTEPIQQARETWYKLNPARKNRAFMDLQVFPAKIRLNQGFGRLIRTKTDTGVVAILDPRLTNGGGWKNDILRSLPKAPKTTILKDPRLIALLK